jgi:tripartite-type tricarboxylate transporter receptor subunit TctC
MTASMGRRAFGALVMAGGLAFAAGACAQAYPQHPITMIVPFAAGGGTDSIARDLARQMQERLGQSVVVDNRGGAGGEIGVDYVAQAAADGYTLLFVTSTFVTHAATEPATSRDILKDFAPIAMIGRGPLLVVANKETGINSLADMIARARAKPNALNFCSAGIGSINHLAGELFEQRAGVKMTHVPYKGSAPAAVDLLAGHVQVFFATVPTIGSYVKADRVKLLAVTSKERSPQFPGAPTVEESGVKDFDVSTWWGVVARAGTPPAIVEKLNASINQSLASKTIQDRLKNEGADAYKGTSSDFGKMLAAELAAWKKTVAAAGIKPQ